MSEKRDALMKHSHVLSDRTIQQVNNYLEYEENDKVRVLVLSGEEKLKGISCSRLLEVTDYSVNGYSTARDEVSLQDILLHDYIIVHTAAMKMAPMQLMNALKLVRKFNKKAFILIDKWNMLPQTAENIEKVRQSAIKDFSMVNVMGIYNIGQSSDNTFCSIEDAIQKISMKIQEDYAEEKKQQVEKIYSFYLEELNDEYLKIKQNANSERQKLEQYSNNVTGFQRSNNVKIRNVSSELNLYSIDLYKKWNLITAEECIGDLECDEKEELRKHIHDEYIKFVMKDFNEITDIVKENYQKRLTALRENMISEMYLIREKLNRLVYADEELISELDSCIEDIESIDEMMNNVNDLLKENTEQLERKVKKISRSIFDQESIGGKLKEKIKELLEEFEDKDNLQVEESVKKEALVRTYYNNVIEKCNVQLFSEVDVFVGVVKENLEKRSEKMIDKYYINIGKCFSEIEGKVEKDFIVI